MMVRIWDEAEMEDFIGDISFLVFKLAHVLDVDVEKALDDRLKEFEARFPAEFMKANSIAGNRRAGGIDLKYQVGNEDSLLPPI